MRPRGWRAPQPGIVVQKTKSPWIVEPMSFPTIPSNNPGKQKARNLLSCGPKTGGMDETRTRDLLRDRQTL